VIACKTGARHNGRQKAVRWVSVSSCVQAAVLRQLDGLHPEIQARFSHLQLMSYRAPHVRLMGTYRMQSPSSDNTSVQSTAQTNARSQPVEHCLNVLDRCNGARNHNSAAGQLRQLRGSTFLELAGANQSLVVDVLGTSMMLKSICACR
jgi:hypothetical protein